MDERGTENIKVICKNVRFPKERKRNFPTIKFNLKENKIEFVPITYS